MAVPNDTYSIAKLTLACLQDMIHKFFLAYGLNLLWQYVATRSTLTLQKIIKKRDISLHYCYLNNN